jgi:hypothetical protein
MGSTGYIALAAAVVNRAVAGAVGALLSNLHPMEVGIHAPCLRPRSVVRTIADVAVEVVTYRLKRMPIAFKVALVMRVVEEPVVANLAVPPLHSRSLGGVDDAARMLREI